MTVYILDPSRLASGLDAEDRRALATLSQRVVALAPLFRPALMARLQLGAILFAYLLAAGVIAVGLSIFLGRFR